MAETPKSTRLWIVLRMLSVRQQGVTLREMAEETGIGERTVRRDLDALRAAGYGLVERAGPRGRKFWKLDDPRSVPPPTFDFDELAALHLGRAALDSLEGTVFAEAARTVLAKICAGLPEAARRYLETLGSVVHRTRFGRGEYGPQREVVEALRAAVEDRSTVVMTYRSMRATEPVEYEVLPLGIVVHKESLYLVAWSRDHGEVRHFKVDRVGEVDAKRVPVRRIEGFDPAAFDLKAHCERAFGIFAASGPPRRVRIRFTAKVARFVEESTWHPTQRLTRQRDGTLVAEFDLPSFEEATSWLLSFGPHAEVLEPEDLRETVRRELEGALAAYRKTKARNGRGKARSLGFNGAAASQPRNVRSDS